jgi:hypothetical protein
MGLDRGANFTTEFKKLTDALVAKQVSGIDSTINYFRQFIYAKRDARAYTPEEVERIIASGSLEE